MRGRVARLGAAGEQPVTAGPEDGGRLHRGLSAGSSDAGAAIGATVSCDLTDRLAIEGSGAYLDRGPGADAIAVNASLIVNLTPHAEKSVPYIAAGLGIYRASFDLGHSRFFGAPGSSFGLGYGAGVCAPGAGHGMGPGFGGLNGPCQYGQFPGFYRQRLGPLDVTPGLEWGSRHFSDPAFTLGGGLRLNLTPRLALRPNVRALIVMRDCSRSPGRGRSSRFAWAMPSGRRKRTRRAGRSPRCSSRPIA